MTNALTIPINDTILFWLYNAIGIDPSACSQFVSDAMPLFACILLCLMCVGCLCLFKWFYRLCKW